MRATWIHYFFAQDWPAKIWLGTFVFGAVVVVGILCWPLVVSVSDWWQPILALACVLIAAVLGYFVGIFVGWPILGPLDYERSIRNGEPFREGDFVQILVGPYCGQIVRVKSAWDFADYAGAHRIKVDLGPDIPDGADYFSSLEILRIRDF